MLVSLYLYNTHISTLSLCQMLMGAPMAELNQGLTAADEEATALYQRLEQLPAALQNETEVMLLAHDGWQYNNELIVCYHSISD